MDFEMHRALQDESVWHPWRQFHFSLTGWKGTQGSMDTAVAQKYREAFYSSFWTQRDNSVTWSNMIMIIFFSSSVVAMRFHSKAFGHETLDLTHNSWTLSSIWTLYPDSSLGDSHVKKKIRLESTRGPRAQLSFLKKRSSSDCVDNTNLPNQTETKFTAQFDSCVICPYIIKHLLWCVPLLKPAQSPCGLCWGLLSFLSELSPFVTLFNIKVCTAWCDKETNIQMKTTWNR